MWNEVMHQFRDRSDPIGVIHRLSEEWAERFGLDYDPIGPDSDVVKETWTHEQVGEHLDRLAKIEPRLITGKKPRRLDGALVILDFGEGRIGQIDGRRRANVWRNTPAEYEVLRVVC